MPQATGDPVQAFLAAARQVRASGLGTAEQSYYPAVVKVHSIGFVFCSSRNCSSWKFRTSATRSSPLEK